MAKAYMELGDFLDEVKKIRKIRISSKVKFGFWYSRREFIKE